MVQSLQMHEEKGNKIIRQHVYAIKEKEKRKQSAQTI